jgi:GntR family transcriptional repressor for pyruvate dehydrogenase complex
VSRTAVREALRTLSAQGLISIVKGKGMFVRDSFSDIVTDPMRLYLQLHMEQGHVMDIIKARQIIEPSIAASAATYHTKDDLKRLQQDIEEMKECVEGFTTLARLDMQFHLNIAKASQNSIMPLILHPIHRLLPEIKSTVYATNEDARESALEWHGKILTQIVRRSADGAFQAMTEHLRIAERHARKMLKAQTSIANEHAVKV